MTSETKFRPVTGAEKDILKLGQHPGWIYFTSDTGKIYLDIDEENRVSMGGNGASLFYGFAKNVQDKEQADGTFKINRSDLEEENSSNVKPNDLILNEDGGFYKVEYILEDSLYCRVMAVSGTGTGGSGTGTGGEGGSTQGISLTLIDSVPAQFIYGQKYEIKHKVEATDDLILTISYRVITTFGDSTVQNTYVEVVTSGDIHTFDIGSKLGRGTNSITVTVDGPNSGQATKRYTNRNCIVMSLESSDNFNPLNVFNGAFDFFCIPHGGSNSFKQKLEIYIDGILQNDLTKNEITSDGAVISVGIPAQTHGAHTLKAVLSDLSNTVQEFLEYSIACSETGVDTPIVWIKEVPKGIVDHNNLDIQYRVYDPTSANGRTVIERRLNGDILFDLEVDSSANESKWLNWRVVGYQVGTNLISLICRDVVASIEVEIEKDSRDLDIITSGLLLNLNAEGRSLDENKTDREIWEYTDVNGKNTKVSFKNFNWYNNGWKTDKDGYTCLRISNGASIQIPLSVFQVEKLSSDSAYSFEFVFKLRNVKSYDSLIKTVSTGRFDDEGNEIFKKQIVSTEGVWLNYYNNHVGFCLGTQECFFTGSNTTVSGRYMEDEVIHLTFVVENSGSMPLMYVYINGIASGIAQYPDSEGFNNNGLKTLTINSDYCDVDLYKLRVYKMNLTAENVVHNYIADYVDAKMYDANKICKYDSGIPTIDFDLMAEYNKNNPDNILMPYMILESPDGILPYYKDETSDGRSNFKVTFKNPSLDRDWENKVIQGYFDKTNSSTYDEALAAKWGTAENYYIHHAPSYQCSTGVYLNVQGTSSQGYPRRNYKAKFKDAGSAGYWTYTSGPKEGESFEKWFLDSNVGETSFCFKADYMESSRTHNTGFANFVDTFYSKHPLNDYGIDSAKSADYRTAIYGFPMMVFHRYNGKTEFIGLYNYNLDKSCKDSFGFTNKAKSHMMVTVKATADTVINPLKDYYTMNDDKTILSYADKLKAGKTYYEAVDEEGENTFTLPVDLASAAECWQIEHNRGDNCSFKNANFDSLSEDPKTAGIIKAAAEDYEIRYHSDKDNIEYAVGGSGPFEGFQKDSINKFLKKKISRLEKMVTWVSDTDPENATNEPLDEVYTFTDGTEYTHDTAEYRLAKFSKEFEEHFDLEYCIVYYIATEILLCYDSRGKNCMLATWGPQVDGGNDIWYPIFYDIDTQLGINNSGVPYWDYYEEASNNKTFSTNNSVLWNNLWKTKKTAILAKYASLRGDKMSLEKIDGSYDFNPEVTGSYAMRGERPLIAINVDEYYKYIDPAIGKGYYDTSNTIQHTNTFFYCLQGTRQLQRKLFLRNRFNYMDSMWNASTYSTTGIKIQVAMRFDANYYDETSDKWLYTVNPDLIGTTTEDGFIYTDQYPLPLDTDLTFEITPYLKQYVHMQIDDTKTESLYTDAGVPVKVEAPTDVAQKVKTDKKMQQQLIYFGGINYISSLGDLSMKYLDQFQLTGGGKRLRDLILGNDAEGYFNKKLVNGSAFALNDSAYNYDGTENESAKTLLETVVLTNLSGLDGSVDLSGSEKLRELRALNTSISSFEFAEGVQLETVYLPETITNITFIEPTSLKNILSDAKSYTEEEITYNKTTVTADDWEAETYYVIDRNSEDGYSLDKSEEYSGATAYFTKDIQNLTKYNKGLYIEGVTNKEIVNQLDATSIQTIKIRGGNMGYDSYKLLDKIVQIKTMMIKNQNLDNSNYGRKLYTSIEGVNWSPFVLVEKDEPYKSNLLYKKKTDHCTLEDYTYDKGTWDVDVLNGKIYEYYPDLLEENKNVITDLSLLDIFIADYNKEGDYPDVMDNNILVSSKDSNWFESTTQYSDGRRTYPTLSGFVYINNTTPIKESDIENKYRQYWPDLQIYAKNVEKSYLAKFIVENGNIETLIDSQKFDSGMDVNEIQIANPSKVPTLVNKEFSGWVDETNKSVPVIEDTGEFDFSSYKFSATKKEFVFKASFIDRQLNIKLYANPNDVNSTNIKVSIGTKLSDAIPERTAYNPFRNDSQLGVNEAGEPLTYAFSHWSLTKPVQVEGQDDKEPAVDLQGTIVNKDYTLYANYKVVSVYDNIIPSEFFINSNCYSRYVNSRYLLNTSYPLQSRDGSTINDIEKEVSEKNGIVVFFDRIADVLKGKITIPRVVSYNGVSYPVIGIFKTETYDALGQPDFKQSEFEVTHIYWEDDRNGNPLKVRLFGEQAFANWKNLKYVEIPETLRVIENFAFSGCSNLEMPKLEDKKIIFIGNGAFQNAVNSLPENTLIIPGSLASQAETLRLNAFTNLALRGNYKLQFGSADNFATYGYESLGANSFSNDGRYKFTEVLIYEPENKVSTIEQIFGDSALIEKIFGGSEGNLSIDIDVDSIHVVHSI